MTTDYILITPDGQLAEKTGYPANAVGCHGYSGQTLHQTRTAIYQTRTLRVMTCDCSLAMTKEHPENPVATTVIGALGYPIPFRGDVAIYPVDLYNEPLEMNSHEIEKIKTLATVARAATEAGINANITVVNVPATDPKASATADGADPWHTLATADGADPWHTLKVTSTYFHDDPMCQAAIDRNGDCPGHAERDDSIRERDNEYEVTHPDDCPNQAPECWTERAVIDGDYENELGELHTGTYRIQMSAWHSSTPNGDDYDEKMTIEPLPASESAAAA